MSDSSKQQQSGAQVIINSLLKEKVEYVFGYPGGMIIPFYNALYDAPLKHILTRHEQGAAHAADGYARVSGKVGVVIATSGPGATNIVTGLANAQMDSIPMVAITGQVTTKAIGNDSFQEIDIYGISIPITKYNYLLKKAEEIPYSIAEAFFLASSGRPGPVLIDIPRDLQVASIEDTTFGEIKILGYDPCPELDLKQLDSFLEALESSHRPLAYIGGGINSARAEKELYDFLIKTQIPVVSTLMGKGAFPENHSLNMGFVGMHGSMYANKAIYEADLIIGLGVRFDDRVAGNVDKFSPAARIVHVDIDPVEIDKRLQASIPIVGDVKNVLTEINKQLNISPQKQWLAHLAQLKDKHPLTYDKNSTFIKPQGVIKELSDLVQGEAIIVTDVGQHQMWAAQWFVCHKPRRFLSSGGLGTMGFGLPAALGAQVGQPDLPVVLITGDGSIQMCIQELATIRQYNLPVKVLILNNGCLGMVRQWQEFFFDKRYSSTIFDFQPDFCKLAEAYDIAAQKVTDPSKVKRALEEMMAHPGAYVLDMHIDPTENVLPIIPSGGGQIDFFNAKV